jgi:hypothetical protein
MAVIKEKTKKLLQKFFCYVIIISVGRQKYNGA